MPVQLKDLSQVVSDPTGAPSTTAALKLAVTDFIASIVTTHVPVPEQAPLQPVKIEPFAGSADRVTCVL